MGFPAEARDLSPPPGTPCFLFTHSRYPHRGHFSTTKWPLGRFGGWKFWPRTGRVSVFLIDRLDVFLAKTGRKPSNAVFGFRERITAQKPLQVTSPPPQLVGSGIHLKGGSRVEIFLEVSVNITSGICEHNFNPLDLSLTFSPSDFILKLGDEPVQIEPVFFSRLSE